MYARLAATGMTVLEIMQDKKFKYLFLDINIQKGRSSSTMVSQGL